MLKLRKREELLEVSKGDKNMSEVYKKLDDLSKDKYYALLYDEEEKKAYENKCILEDAIEDAKENGYSSGYNSGYCYSVYYQSETGKPPLPDGHIPADGKYGSSDGLLTESRENECIRARRRNDSFIITLQSS